MIKTGFRPVFEIKALQRHSGWLLPLAALILACLPYQSLLAEDCVKQVFNRYCLGGDIRENLEIVAPDLLADLTKEAEQSLSLVSAGKTIELGIENGITVNVTRLEEPGDWINYTAWKVKLVRLYGRGTELSNFPAYAGSRSSRLNAINAGRGHVEFAWEQPGYTVKLTWDHPDHIKLQYLLTSAPQSGPENTEGL